MLHKVSTLQQHAKDIPFEQAKWFAKDITEFSELNINSLAKWITIAKKVIRSSRRQRRKTGSKDSPNSLPSTLHQVSVIKTPHHQLDYPLN